jgi:hypothetical protein
VLGARPFAPEPRGEATGPHAVDAEVEDEQVTATAKPPRLKDSARSAAVSCALPGTA